MRELAHRTLSETRESGAYLLGKTLPNGVHEILDFVFYDDIDPDALSTGIVTIRQNALPRLWKSAVSAVMVLSPMYTCILVALVRASLTRANPVMPRVGHIAFILPTLLAIDRRRA